MRTTYKIFVYSFICLLILSCRKDSLITDTSAKLEIMADTVLFDTVFTTIGSATRQFKVRNKYKQSIKVTSITLAGGNQSNFRLNIDGAPVNSVQDIEIPPEDSIYIFVEVNVNPTNSSSPVVILDSVVFMTNGNYQDVKLVAYGQDVHLINGEIIQSQTWTKEKPYLVYNSMLVDSEQTLTIEAGTRIYFHKNSDYTKTSKLYVKGTLIVNGTKDEPVVFQGDRLEHIYDEIPGQWGYIHLLSGSKRNYINYAEIKNGIMGIQVDTNVSNTGPTLVLMNTKIENMTLAGILGQGAYILAGNCVLANCGYYSAALTIGGYYEFFHCTFANYWAWSRRTTPAVLISNYYKDKNGVYQVRGIITNFRNCIIYGSESNEISLDMFPSTDPYFTYIFDHCLLKVSTDINTDDGTKFIEIVKNEDPKFKSVTQKYDYELDSLSVAIRKGKPEWVNIFSPLESSYLLDLTKDLNNEPRPVGNAPDLGAYQRE